jgi:hypothetical protein
MQEDRTDLNKLAAYRSDILDKLIRMYDERTLRSGALPWQVVPPQTASPKDGMKHIHDV